jgi:hypothetical protein
MSTMLFSINPQPISRDLPSYAVSTTGTAAKLSLHRSQNGTRTTVVAESVSSCDTALHSREWLQGPRLGNSNTSVGLDYHFARAMILEHHTPTLFGHTVCHKDSRFLNDDDSIRRWTVRLLYLVLHQHQHRPAVDEAKQLSSNDVPCQQIRQDHGIGPFDFECPAAKFLVVRFTNNGIGANMRITAVPAFMAGLASNRVVLFVNQAPAGPAFLQQPWTLASCPRRDAQCFFLPTSPCVLTHAELEHAYTLQRGEMRRLFRYGTLPEEREGDRVLLLHLNSRPHRVPENLQSILYNQTLALIHEHDTTLTTDVSILVQAAQAILEDDLPPTDSYNYYGVNSALHHSLVLYALRPNPRAVQQIDEILREVVPSDFVPDQAMGLPIRGAYDILPRGLYRSADFLSHLCFCYSFGQVWNRVRMHDVLQTHASGARNLDATSRQHERSV